MRSIPFIQIIGKFFLVITVAVALCVVLFLGFFIAQSKYIAYTQTKGAETVVYDTKEQTDALIRFPVGVYPRDKRIEETQDADVFYGMYIKPKSDILSSHTTWFGRVLGKLALMSWYQNLASVSTRTLVIQSGERKEQIASNFGKILRWNDTDRKDFLKRIEGEAPELTDGKFFPGSGA
jgi:hypothetical protein